MMNEGDAQVTWLPVIGKSLAYICLHLAQKDNPEKLDSVLKRVKFLEGFGMSRADAAEAAGSSADSVRILEDRKSKGRKGKNGSRKKKTGG